MEKHEIDAGLHSIILSNPDAISAFVGETVGFEGYDGISAAHLVIGQIRDKEFAGKLADLVGDSFEGEFSHLSGDKREKIANILEAAINYLPMAKALIDPKKGKKETPVADAEVKTKEDPKAKIMGIPKAIFFLGIAVIALIGLYMFFSRK